MFSYILQIIVFMVMTIVGAVLGGVQMIVAADGASEIDYRVGESIRSRDCSNSELCREVVKCFFAVGQTLNINPT